MTNALTIIITLLIVILPITSANGSLEIVARSPSTVVIEPTVCAEFECQGPDDLTPGRKVAGGVPLRFHSGRYEGASLEYVNVYIKVFEPVTHGIIAFQHLRPKADNVFTSITVPTDLGFNLTVEIRNHCSENYYGKRCAHRCQSTDPRKSHCDSNGMEICNAGWTGQNCSTPECPNKCNGHGKCESPGRCVCDAGFRGPDCGTCIPSGGCAHGTCNGNEPFTCACKPGFAGKFCDVDSNVCATERPCRNGGKCSFDTTSDVGFRCDCPFEFFGMKCETPLSRLRCPETQDSVCRNGGVCFSPDNKNIQCKCRPGFFGTYCQIGRHVDCSTKTCSRGSTCRMIDSQPLCVGSHIDEYTANTQASQHQVLDDMQRNMLFITCFLLIIVGLCFATYTVYCRFIVKPLGSTPTTDPAAQLPTFSTTTSPVCKVCVVSAECNGSSSDGEPDNFYNSPPPAYSSPIVPRYKKIPTDNEPYKDCIV